MDTQNASSEAYMSPDEIEDELQFQRILLQSIDHTVANREAALKEVQKDISRLEQRLRKIKNQARGQTAFGSNANTNSTAMNTFDADPFPDVRAAAVGDTFDPFASSSSNSTPPSTNANGESLGPQFKLASRKRGRVDHLEPPHENKSRRTSQSPGMTRHGTPSTSDEEADIAAAHRRQREAAIKIEQERADEVIARALQAELGSPSWQPQTSFQGPRAPLHAGTSEDRNAFSKIMGRDSFETRAKSENSSSQPKFDNEDELVDNFQMNQAPRWSMPGTFPSQDESGDSDIEIISADLFSPNHKSAGSALGGKSQNSKHGFMSSSRPKYTPEVAGASRAALLRAEFDSHNRAAYGIGTLDTGKIGAGIMGAGFRTSAAGAGSPQLSAFGGYGSHVQSNTNMRPGFVQNGAPPAYSINQAGGSNVYGNLPSGFGSIADASPSSQPFPGDLIPNSSILSSTTSRTGKYDYQSMVDIKGNPLDPRIMEEYDDYVSDPRKTEQEIKDLLQHISNDTEIPKENREGTPAALKYALYEHQKLALTWLKQMEEGTNKGGILADDMGLGKTISALALMQSHPSEDRNRKTTLIIGPVALIRQWDREIHHKSKASHRLSTFIFHGNHKAGWDVLRNYDVVLTTYGTIGHEFKKMETWLTQARGNPDMDVSDERTRFPFLGKNSLWYRIILDEAQCIKNKGTKAAQGACWLKSQYRFCLTGTPMMNGVHELYSLIHFLRIKPYNEYKRFQEDFQCLSKDKNTQGSRKRAMKRLQVLLKAVMLRRTKSSKIDDKPILELPTKTELVDHVLFNEDEQAYYTSLESKSKLQFNKYQKAGTIGKNYSNILVLLLRLRQAACHPHLIMDFEQAPADTTKEEMVELAKALDHDVVRRIIEAAGEFECPICYDMSPNPRIVIPCGHDTCSECLVKITTNAQDQAIQEGNETGGSAKCPTCRGRIIMNRVIDYQTFKNVYMPGDKDDEVSAEEEESNDSSNGDDENDSDDDSTEEGDNGNLNGFVVPDDCDSDDADDDDDTDVVVVPKKQKRELAIKDEDEDDMDIAPPRSSTKLKGKAFAKNEDDSDDDVFDVPKAPRIAKIKAKPKSKGKGKGKVSVKSCDDDDDDNDLDELPDIGDIVHDNEEHNLADHIMKKQEKANKRKKSAKSKKSKTKKKGKKQEPAHHTLAMLKKEAMKNAKNRKIYMKYLKDNWVSSAKTDKCIQILQAREEGIKTIIFSQFTTLLDLLEIPVKGTFGKCYRRYDGSMSADARNQAVVDFSEKPNVTIMLVSLKAGNAGLNLVAASEVIILDPFWNPYIEMQAVDRAHRIGQQKPVMVHRILVKATVEDRILALQEKKRALVDAALDENASAGLAKLGHAELAYLFNASGIERETANRGESSAGPSGYDLGRTQRVSSGIGGLVYGYPETLADSSDSGF